MAVGEFENISSPAETIELFTLGWTLDPAETLGFDNNDDTAEMNLIRQCEELITAGKLELRRADTSVVAAAEVQGFFLNESIVGDELEPQAVRKTRLDISTSGEAVITRLVPGVGVALSETGVDQGTGEVTIDVAAGVDNALYYISCGRRNTFARFGISWMSGPATVPHNQCGFTLDRAGILRAVWVTVNLVDSVNDWQMRLYRNPTIPGRVLVDTQVMPTGQRTFLFTGLNVALVAGEYGMAGFRNGPTSASSNFTRVAAGIIVEVTV